MNSNNSEAPTLADYSADYPSYADYADDHQQPYDDAPAFDHDEHPEIDTELRLQSDRKVILPAGRRLFKDYRADPNAYRHLEPLPMPGETLHGWISGKYALFELIPALIEHKGPIQELWIATLSFSQSNAADLLALFDGQHVRRINVLISYYFRSTSKEIYESLIPQLRERGQRTLVMRNHCKLLLAKMASGEMYTVESSANLRSSVNTEIFTLSPDPDLYRFHAEIMNELFETRKDLGD